MNSTTLVSLKVSAVKLKCLSIRNCWELKSVELLDAVNLESFTCICLGFETCFPVKNIPRLIELSCLTAGNIDDKLRYLQLLETLKLRMPTHTTFEGMVGVCKNPQVLNDVKHLELSSRLYFPHLLYFTPLLKACPLLRTFRFVKYTGGYTREDRVEPEKQYHGYKHLKVVEFIGYDGSPASVEFVIHLIENAETLEKVIVDPYPRASLPDDLKLVDHQNGRQSAMELGPKLPPWIEFVII